MSYNCSVFSIINNFINYRVPSIQNTMEVFGHSIVQGVQASLQHVFTQSVSIALIPAYERASTEMFKQIQEAFVNGTKSCAFLSILLLTFKIILKYLYD